MKKYNLVLALMLLLNFYGAEAQQKVNAPKLSFNKDKSFKITQFTDVHWITGNVGNKATISMMEAVLDMEQPDMVVFTGDIVMSGGELATDIKKGWQEVVDPVINRKIKWVAMLGNHDSEGDFPRDSIYNLIYSLPYNIHMPGKNDMHDFSLPIAHAQKQVSSVLYFFDSNAYTGTFETGKYEWISTNQILQYKQASDGYIKSNNGTPVPALAFFHIPLPEYKEVMEQKESIVGHANEDVSSPDINSGLFAKIIQQGDIMGIFTGHDHNNDFIGELYSVALAYGRCSGNNAYGDLRLGSRTIKLYADSYKFDTWITTPDQRNYMYKFPAGNSFAGDAISLPSIKVKGKLKQGVKYDYYEGEVSSVDEIETLSKKKSGYTDSFDISLAQQKDHFAFKFEGYIKIPSDDLYTFYLKSDDGSVLYIDGQKIIDNDGGHSPQMKKGHANLKAGFHQIKILYFEDYMGQVLDVGIQSSKMKKGFLSPNLLYAQ